MKKADAVLLASGGADSTTLAYWMKQKGISYIPLFINYGQHCVETERTSLNQHLPSNEFPTQYLNISDIYAGSNSLLIKQVDLWTERVSKEDLHLPYRNLLLLTVASAFAQNRGIENVYSAFINSNHAVEIDCSLDFFNKLNKMLTSTGTVNLVMPFRDMTKLEVLKMGLNLGAPVAQTFSCQVSPLVPCGACPNCVERNLAMSNLLTHMENN